MGLVRRLMLSALVLLTALTLATTASQAPAQTSLNFPFAKQLTKPVAAFVGDSITYAAIGANTATGTFNTARGPSYWVRFQSGQRISSPQAMNFGVNGDTTNALLARMPAVLASGATDYFLLIGANDIAQVPVATTQSNIRSIVTQMLATGARVHLSTILPRQLATAADRAQLLLLNTFIRSLQFQYERVTVADPSLAFVDPAATDMAPRTGQAYDGLHPTILGANAFTQTWVAQTIQLYPSQGTTPTVWTATDVYDATNNFNGSLTVNGIMAGTGGTNGAGGGTITGSIADSWTLAHSANGGTITSLTTTASKVTLADGRNAQRLVVSGTYSGAGSAAINQGTSIVFRQDLGGLNATNYPVGSQVVLTADIAVAAGNQNISGIECRISTTIGGTTYEIGDGSAYTSDLLPATAYSGTCMTEPFTIPSGSITLMRPSVRIYLRTAASQTAAADLTITGIKLYHP